VQAIRDSGKVGPLYAKSLEDLAQVYEEWTKTEDGVNFRSDAEQAVCANFA
jgi:hypothetical protein